MRIVDAEVIGLQPVDLDHLLGPSFGLAAGISLVADRRTEGAVLRAGGQLLLRGGEVARFRGPEEQLPQAVESSP